MMCRNRFPSPLFGRFILIVLASLGLGCALTDPNHLATTNWVDRHVSPHNPTAQWAMAPVLVPTCLVLVGVDNLIVAPVVHLPSATADVRDWWAWNAGSLGANLAAVPLKAAATPPVFVGSWVGRYLFAIEPRDDAAWGWPVWGLRWPRERRREIIDVLREALEAPDQGAAPGRPTIPNLFGNTPAEPDPARAVPTPAPTPPAGHSRTIPSLIPSAPDDDPGPDTDDDAEDAPNDPRRTIPSLIP